MKSIILSIPIIFFFSSSIAQVQIRDLPEPGFEKRITDYINALELSDSHEHLMTQESVKNSQMLDFMLLLHHYADDDIKSAGLGKAEFAELLTNKYSVKEKWEIVKPYWEASKNTAYNRVVLFAMENLFGIKELNEETVVILSEKIKNAYDTDWYDFVLKEKARIKYAIMDVGSRRMNDDMFHNVEKFDHFIRISSRKDLVSAGERASMAINSLEDMVSALEKSFQEAINRKMIGVKSTAAYHRILKYDNVQKIDAEAVFDRILGSDANFEFDEVKPLQDYMMHQIIQLARQYNIPFQIHTGYHAGDGNYISNSNPALLANLFLEYRDVKFLLFHGSYPYGGELAAMAKGFRNVYLDMSWLYVISPSYAERYLHEWLETVPANKIMAFGGDYHNVENTYGHSLMAREIVAKVLVDKVGTAYITEDEALQVAKRILLTNVIEVFDLE